MQAHHRQIICLSYIILIFRTKVRHAATVMDTLNSPSEDTQESLSQASQEAVDDPDPIDSNVGSPINDQSATQRDIPQPARTPDQPGTQRVNIETTPQSSSGSRERLQRELRATLLHLRSKKDPLEPQTLNQSVGQSYGKILGHFLGTQEMAVQHQMWYKILDIMLTCGQPTPPMSSLIPVQPPVQPRGQPRVQPSPADLAAAGSSRNPGMVNITAAVPIVTATATSTTSSQDLGMVYTTAVPYRDPHMVHTTMSPFVPATSYIPGSSVPYRAPAASTSQALGMVQTAASSGQAVDMVHTTCHGPIVLPHQHRPMQYYQATAPMAPSLMDFSLNSTYQLPDLSSPLSPSNQHTVRVESHSSNSSENSPNSYIDIG